jgi:AbrB family looped-hinge helix DNA binding protein
MDRYTTVDSKGRIEIPEEIRRRHGFEPGAKVKIAEEGDQIVLSHVLTEEIESISDLAGILSSRDPEASGR